MGIKHPTVVSDPFPDSAREHVIGPRPCAGLKVRGYVRRDDPRVGRGRILRAAAGLSSEWRPPRSVRVIWCMTVIARHSGFIEIAAASKSFESSLELPTGQRSRC